jgi:hypothetical protein
MATVRSRSRTEDRTPIENRNNPPLRACQLSSFQSSKCRPYLFLPIFFHAYEDVKSAIEVKHFVAVKKLHGPEDSRLA